MTVLQLESAGYTKNDLAKYPFLKETAEYIKPLDLQIDDLASMGTELVKRAEERVNQALIDRRITRNSKRIDIEIPSFPLALLIVIATENSFIKKRYALAEAKQASSDNWFNGAKEKILKVARDFDWKITLLRKALIHH